jgi:hypothetical protein
LLKTALFLAALLLLCFDPGKISAELSAALFPDSFLLFFSWRWPLAWACSCACCAAAA